jgi:hypothetical protein
VFTRTRIAVAVRNGSAIWMAAGFAVDVHETEDLTKIKERLGVPGELAACHTPEAEGYIIEGHVPALAIQRLFWERPDAAGLAVPGMPVGSPGMEGERPQRYAVILFGKNGQRTVMQFDGAKPIG